MSFLGGFFFSISILKYTPSVPFKPANLEGGFETFSDKVAAYYADKE